MISMISTLVCSALVALLVYHGYREINRSLRTAKIDQAAIQRSQEIIYMLLDAKCPPNNRLDYLERVTKTTGTLDDVRKWTDMGLLNINELGGCLRPLAVRIAEMGNIELLMELKELGTDMIWDDGKDRVVYVEYFPVDSIKKMVTGDLLHCIEFLINNGLYANKVIDHKTEDTLAHVVMIAKKKHMIEPLINIGVDFTKTENNAGKVARNIYENDLEVALNETIDNAT